MPQPSFLVYQFGKVGSRTIKNGILRSGFKTVHHQHLHNEIPNILDNSKEAPLVVITGFREPLTRCISAYFQNLINEGHWYVGTRKQVQEKSLSWLINDFNQKVVKYELDYVRPWFQTYLRLTASKWRDFEPLGSYWKANQDNLVLYIYKQEKMSRFLTDLANETYFNDIRFTHENTGSAKWYGDIYEDFLKHYRITGTEYSRLYQHIDYVKMLYDKKELSRILGSMLVK